MKRQGKAKNEDKPKKDKEDGEKQDKDAGYGVYIRKLEDDRYYFVKEEITEAAKIGIKGSQGKVKGLPSVRTAPETIHLGKMVHTTMAALFKKSKKEQKENKTIFFKSTRERIS